MGRVKYMNSDNVIAGIWWLSDNPGNPIAGDLLLKERRLELNGSFEGMTSRTFGSSFGVISVLQDKTIQGVAKKGGKRYTLEYFDEPTSFSMSMPGYKADTYMLGNIFEGEHFERTDNLSFERYYVEFPYLFEWVGSGVISTKTSFKGKRIGDTTITVGVPTTIEVFKNDSFKLSFFISPQGVKFGPATKEINLSQECTLKIESLGKKISFQEAGSIIRHFERFLTIAVGRNIELTKYTASSGKGQDYQTVHITLHSWQPKIHKNISMHEMNFTYSDIKSDSQNIFDKWFSNRKKYADVFDLLSSLRSDTGKNLNNRFRDIVSAVEGYVSIEKGILDVSPEKAVKTLNEELAKEHRPIVSGEYKKIRITRNKLSHLTIKPADDKYVLSNEGKWFNYQKLLFLLEYALLKNLGTNESALKKFRTKSKRWNDK